MNSVAEFRGAGNVFKRGSYRDHLEEMATAGDGSTPIFFLRSEKAVLEQSGLKRGSMASSVNRMSCSATA
jgi:hypothetical protein